MKKSILAVAVVLGATSTFAQDLTSRKGENYLPEAGDWAIGIDAVPLLNYVGNFFGKGADNMHAGTIWTPNNPALSINGKYFVEDDLAYRGGIRLGFSTGKSTNVVGDRTADPAAPNPWPDALPTVENSWKRSATNIAITAGFEKRKGNTRLQGFYGAEIGFMITSSSNKFTYGNSLLGGTVAADFIEVDAADEFLADANDPFSGVNLDVVNDGTGAAVQTRDLTQKSGIGFAIGVRGFIGAEYFIIPKLSIGGELGWGLGFGLSGKSKTTAETVGQRNGAAESTVETIETTGTKTTVFGFDNSIVNPLFGPVGRLNLTFHF